METFRRAVSENTEEMCINKVASRRGGAAPKVATGASKRSLRVKWLTVRELRNTGKAKHARPDLVKNMLISTRKCNIFVISGGN